MKTKTDYKSILIEINILTIAIAIIAVAVYFFLVPSHTSNIRERKGLYLFCVSPDIKKGIVSKL